MRRPPEPARWRAARSRLPGATVALLTVAAGLGVRTLGGGWVTEYAGDALYTVLLYALVVTVRPATRPLAAAGWALGLSWAVEAFQLTGVPAALAETTPLVRLVLGTTFNPLDLVAYAVGVTVAYLTQRR